MDQVVAQPGAVVFRALIALSRETATGIRVPEVVVEQLDGGRRDAAGGAHLSERSTVRATAATPLARPEHGLARHRRSRRR